MNLLADNGAMCVTDIYVRLRLDQSICSQHLAILRRAGMVEAVRQGKLIWYQLNTERVAAIKARCKELA